MSNPTVSVLMPTYNRDRFVGSAIQSIINQSVADWELIVVDDGSTDSTTAVAASFQDPRISVIKLDENRGIAAARNQGLEEACGRYIAWLDSDDVAKPDRFARQLAFLERRPDVALVGGCAHKIAEDGSRLPGTRVPPMTYDHIRCRLLLTSAFQQSSIMGRADILKANPYDPSFVVCEDVDVCGRIAARHRVRNMPAILVQRRMHKAQISRERNREILAMQLRISRPQFEQLGYGIGDDDLKRLCALARAPASPPTDAELRWAEVSLQQLLAANTRSNLLPQSALCAFVSLLMFDRYRRHSRSRAIQALRGSRFTRGLFSQPSLAWLTAALLAIAC